MARTHEPVGKSGDVKDLSADKLALLRMKELEKKLQKDLVSVRLDKNTVITTTKERMEQLLYDHLHKGPVTR